MAAKSIFPQPICDPTAALNQVLKKKMRSQQRQLAAEHRLLQLEEISKASTNNRQLFYKLVRKQRGPQSNVSDAVIFKAEIPSQINGWATYFEELAAKEDLPHFDGQHHKSSLIKFHTNALQANMLQRTTQYQEVTEAIVGKHINSMKLGKAADVLGTTAEHLKFASPEIVTVMACIVNKSFTDGKLPDLFKTGAIIPTLKKGKPPRDPNSYRRITVASTIGKVLEKEMLRQTKPHSQQHQCEMQYGFTEKCSPSLCSLLVTEAIAEAKDLGNPLYMAFLDSSKAFDVVDHTVLLNSLHGLELV
jgi:hypothetical protein